MSLPRYSEYTSTQDPWIPAVPSLWSLSTLGKLGTFLKGRGGSKQDASEAGVPCIRYGELYTKFAYTIREPVGFVSEDVSSNYLPVQRGDILFAASGEDMADIGRSASLLSNQRTVAGGDLVVLRPTVAHDPEFLGYASDCSAVKAQKAAAGRGTTVKHIYPDELRRVVLALPPVPEQRAIAAFLNRETAKVDALIAEQERLIELLQEKRQAVISHAVAKGLDPNMPMKDSGLLWMGHVPSHWSVKPLRSLGCAVRTGPFGSQLHAEEYIDGGVPVINPAHLRGGIIQPDEAVSVGPDVVERLAHQRLQRGDVIFARRGELGRCAIVSEREAGWICGTGCMVLQMPRDEYLPEFLTVLLGTDGLRQYFESLSIGATIDSLSSADLLSLPVLTPPLHEQHEILAFVRKQEMTFESLSVAAQNAQELLSERRTALITAAVTGQIDVRGLVETAA